MIEELMVMMNYLRPLVVYKRLKSFEGSPTEGMRVLSIHITKSLSPIPGYVTHDNDEYEWGC